MLEEFFSELRAQASERIRNPLLGPFTAAWVVSNWKLVSVLLASSLPIEQRILSIEENYLHASNLLVAPLGFAAFYAIALPWINLGLQHLQEGVNLRRKKHKLGIDTDYLRASVGRAQAQAELNRILARDQIAQEQKEEIEQLKNQLAEQQEAAKSRIAAQEVELEQRRKEFEARSHEDHAAAERERQEIEQLRTQLQEERDKAATESKRVRSELRERQKELEDQLENQRGELFNIPNADFQSVLLSRRFRLFHNPSVGPERSKPISFEAGGENH